MNKNFKIALLLLIIILIVFVFVKHEKVKSEKPVIKIGAILPLTGGKANLGNVARSSAQIAIEEINNANSKYKYEFVIEDDAMQSKKAALAYNKLVNIDKVDAVISWSSGAGNVISPLAEKNEIIHFAMGVDKKMSKGKYNHIHWTMPEDFMQNFINKFNQDNIKNISIVYSEHNGPISIANELKKEIEKNSITLSDFSRFNIGERNYRQELVKIIKNNPDIIVVFMFSPEFEIFVKQLREMGYKKEITTAFYANFIEDKSVIKNMWYVDNKNLDESYKKKLFDLTKSKATFGAANIYDIVKIIGYSFENENSENKPIDIISKVKNYRGKASDLYQDENGIFHSETIVKVAR